MKAVILAAGAGTRLGELGRQTTKPMLSIVGRPLLAWVIDSLRAVGIGEFIVVGHPADQGLAQFVLSSCGNAELVFQSQRLGMADALGKALAIQREAHGVLVSASDSVFLRSDLERFVLAVRSNPEDAFVGLLEMDAQATAERSAVVVSGLKVVSIVEKPRPGSVETRLVAAPIYWVPKSAFQLCHANPTLAETHITHVLQDYLRGGGKIRYTRFSSRLEITRGEDLPAGELWLKKNYPSLGRE